MKVLLLAPGKSIHTHKWALFYKNKGMDVKVVTFPDHYSAENAKEIDTIQLPKLLPGKLSYFSSVFALKKALNDFKPDIFHAHYVSSYGFVGALANYHPFYLSVWGRDIFQFPRQGMLNRKMAEFTLRKADVICSTSHVMAKETNLYTDKNIFVTPFGVELNKFKPLAGETLAQGQTSSAGETPSAPLTIGTVKALSDKYGIADLIKAFSKIHSSTPKSRLLIVGDGPQRAEYERLTESLGISAVTTFTGRVPNDEVPAYINQMDIFAVPSTEDSESFGVAAVESMACGVPVVVSNVGGLPEVVIEGKTGYVVPKENPDELAKAFLKLIENPDIRKEMGANGIRHVKEQYDWIENATGMVELYEKTLKKGMKS
ncbi:MAG: glycosyltransferase [Bacillota bacterium]|nr:glycosyltransferase [Bacillota bacterium]MDP4171066.1 glycosyltransferase [Bacillota bacterium]